MTPLHSICKMGSADTHVNTKSERGAFVVSLYTWNLPPFHLLSLWEREGKRQTISPKMHSMCQWDNTISFQINDYVTTVMSNCLHEVHLVPKWVWAWTRQISLHGVHRAIAFHLSSSLQPNLTVEVTSCLSPQRQWWQSTMRNIFTGNIRNITNKIS